MASIEDFEIDIPEDFPHLNKILIILEKLKVGHILEDIQQCINDSSMKTLLFRYITKNEYYNQDIRSKYIKTKIKTTINGSRKSISKVILKDNIIIINEGSQILNKYPDIFHDILKRNIKIEETQINSDIQIELNKRENNIQFTDEGIVDINYIDSDKILKKQQHITFYYNNLDLFKTLYFIHVINCGLYEKHSISTFYDMRNYTNLFDNVLSVPNELIQDVIYQLKLIRENKIEKIKFSPVTISYDRYTKTISINIGGFKIFNSLNINKYRYQFNCGLWVFANLLYKYNKLDTFKFNIQKTIFDKV